VIVGAAGDERVAALQHRGGERLRVLLYLHLIRIKLGRHRLRGRHVGAAA
jgi:hypothetical protein